MGVWVCGSEGVRVWGEGVWVCGYEDALARGGVG